MITSISSSAFRNGGDDNADASSATPGMQIELMNPEKHGDGLRDAFITYDVVVNSVHRMGLPFPSCI
jgi:hypothetical protein